MKLTPIQLKNTVPNLSLDRATSLSNIINIVCPLYGINTFDRLHEFIATLAHESGGFRIKTENMSYTTPERIMAIWSTRFPTRASALPYVRNPKALANKVYNGRMGNRAGTDDGYNFRGGGFIQLTGRYSYEQYKKYKDKNNQYTIEQIATLIRTNDSLAIDSACWEFAIDKNLLGAADRDDFLYITKRINGAYIGLADRKYYYERAKKYIV